MNTTNIFSELLITGTGGLVWYGLLVACFFGPDSFIFIIQSGSINQFIVAALAFVSAYFLGVLLDRAYVPLWSKFDENHRKDTYPKLEEYNKAQVLISVKSENGTEQLLDFYRSRIRILRGSMINFTLIAVFGSLAFRENINISMFIFFSASIISFLSCQGYGQLSKKLYTKTKEAEIALT
jgi:hypothetical protein